MLKEISQTENDTSDDFIQLWSTKNKQKTKINEQTEPNRTEPNTQIQRTK